MIALRGRLLLCAVFAVGAVGAVPSIGWAQASEEDTATARLLFNEGRTFAQNGQWEDAADRFRRALTLRQTPAIRFNLATALIQIHRYVEASEQLRALQRDPAAGDRLHDRANELLPTIEPKIGRLTIRLTGDSAAAEVTLDGHVVPAARIGVPNSADPGRHVVVVHRGSAEVSREAQVPEGGPAEVVVAVPIPPPAEVAQAVRPDVSALPVAPPPPPSRPGLLSKWWFWTAVGVVVVGGGATILVLSNRAPAPIAGSGGVVTLP